MDRDTIPYKNMTEKQRQRQEQEYARIIMFGSNLMSDRIIGRHSDAVEGSVLCDTLYQQPAESWFPVPFGEEEMPSNEDLSMNQVPE